MTHTAARSTYSATLDRLQHGQPVSNDQARRAIRTLRCFYCGLEGGTIDHWHPLVHDGDDKLFNWRPCCKPCNGLKADQLPDVWLAHCQRNWRSYAGFLNARERAPGATWWQQRFEELRTDVS